MIREIEGIISKKEPSNIIVKTNCGIGYGIFISLFTYNKIDLGQKINFLITQIIKEDANLLFGFLDIDEQKMFNNLIKVNGVGPSTAMAVCSSFNFSDFSRALMNNDDKIFSSVPGIGSKTARRIITELSDSKFINENVLPAYQNEAFMALQSLGFKSDKIGKILNSCTSTDTSSLIKEALSKLS